MFITFEGLDCSGKSTQAKLLVERLRLFLPGIGRNQTVHLIREPGGTRISERVREILLDRRSLELNADAELLLFSASRAQLVREVIVPALARREFVVCDRFLDSTTAYQGYGRGVDLQAINSIHRIATAGITPDLTLLMDIPLEEVRRRKTGMNAEEDRMEASGESFYRRVRDGYLDLATREKNRIAVLDGTKSVEVVARAVWTIVERLIQNTEQDFSKAER